MFKMATILEKEQIVNLYKWYNPVKSAESFVLHLGKKYDKNHNQLKV